MTETFAQQLEGYGPPTPVPIFQWEPEFEFALKLYKIAKPKRVLEVGTYHGGTLYHWLTNAVPGATIVSLDSYGVGVDNRHLYEEWVPDDVVLHVYEGDSNNPGSAEAVGEHGPFDWLFIDAGHYLHEVRADWELYRPLAADRACVLFHDILPPTQEHPEIEVAYLWQEIQREYETLEIVHDRSASWGGIGVVLL